MNTSVAEEVAIEPTPSKKSRRSLTLKLLIFFVVILLAALGSVVGGVYGLGWQGSLIRAVEEVVPLPVALVNGRIVPLADYNLRFEAYQRAIVYNQAFDFSDPKNKPLVDQQKAALLNRLVELKLQELLAGSRNISVTAADIDRELLAISAQAKVPAESLDELFGKIYGWNRRQFTDNVIVPQIRERKLQNAVSRDPVINAPALSRAREVQQKLLSGGDFAKLAGEYSDDSGSKKLGGDLGWQPRGAFVPEFEEAAGKLKPGEISDPVATQYGFHLIQLLERNDKAKDKPQIHLRHILVASKDFSEWMKEQAEQAWIWKFPVP